MDKKSFDIVLDEIRKCVLTDQRIKAIEQVHGYFSSEQVIDILKYFSWAEPQIKAVKALQHKMVAIPTTKAANILNSFTFSKDRLVVLELIALNICDAKNYHPVEDVFRIQQSEKKRARRILEQVCKVGCKAPVAMISSCGMIPGNPYPKGKPSKVTGTFPGIPGKRDGEDAIVDAKGIISRILGASKPSPSTYNPHRPVPYPIPPCRPHATIAPSAYNNAGLVSRGGVITANVPPPPYRATPSSAGYSRPASQQNQTSNTSGTPAISPHISTPATPGTSQPTTPITPVFPGMVPSPAPAPSTSVIKGPPIPAGSPHVASNSSGHTAPSSPFSVMPPSGRNTPSVIKTPSGTPCGTPGPSFPPSPFQGGARSETPSGRHTPTPRVSGDPSTPHGAAMGLPSKKGYPTSLDSQSAHSFPGGPSTQSHSVIRSYTPSGMSPLTPGRLTPSMQNVSGLPTASASPSPKPTSMLPNQPSMSPAGAYFSEQHAHAMARHGGGSGSNSPIPSAFKGPSRSGTPCLSSLVMPNSGVLTRPMGGPHGTASPQPSLPSSAPGHHGLTSALGAQSASHFSALSPFPGAQSGISTPSTPTPPTSSVYSGLAHSSAPTHSPFGLGLTTAQSVFPGLPAGPNPGFPGFGGSGPSAAGSPVLSSLMGLPGASCSVATVAPLQAAAAAAAAAAGVPSSSPVLPGFASAFSSNFNPALVGQAGLQAPGGGAFPGLLSFSPGIPSFSTAASPAALSGLHNPAMQSALLQAHSASALDSYAPQPNGFTNYPAAAGPGFQLQPGLHPSLGWQ